MKLIVVVVQDRDSPRLISRLIENGFRATKLASTGGFLRQGNSTLLIGVEDDKVDEVMELIRLTCRSTEQLVTPFSPLREADIYHAFRATVGGATVFVLNVERLERV